MVSIAQGANGLSVYRAIYSLTDDAIWAITIETEAGLLRTTAGRLADVERRAYEAVRNETGLESNEFEVAFVHQLELADQQSLPSALPG